MCRVLSFSSRSTISDRLLNMIDSARPRITFLGIGLMGRPMTTRLLQAGYAVTVWNRTPDKLLPVLALGAMAAPSPDLAVCDADIVITMLDAGPVVVAVLGGALPAMRPGTLIIDMSSTAQAEAVVLDNLTRSYGAAFLDAPVSGGVIGAEQGTLAIMVGASSADYDRAKAVLEVLGRPTLVGPVGCGQLAKLCNQLIVGGTISIIAEALLLAQSGGADPGAVRAAIRGGFAESRILEVHGERMLQRNFTPGGQVRSQAKDMNNVMQAASAAGLNLPVSTLVTTIYQSILDTLGDADQAAALLALERLNPGKRVGNIADCLPPAIRTKQTRPNK